MLLTETAAAWGLPLTETQLTQFATYTSTLQIWNVRVNLTAITDAEGIVVRHFLDSLRCACAWGDSPTSLIDIGSGAGFPGIPLKILRPTLRLTLVESVGKKAAFLRHIVKYLALDDVTVLDSRAEVIAHYPQHREQYEVATARAVAELRVLAEYGLPLVRSGGRLLTPKGTDVAAELTTAERAIITLGGQVLAVEPVTLPGVDPRTLVVIGKMRSTPPIYPRAVGLPARRPL